MRARHQSGRTCYFLNRASSLRRASEAFSLDSEERGPSLNLK